MSKSLKIGDLEVKIPVVQGGMGVGISLSGLAGNVSACGGLGVISTAQIGWREPDFYEKPFEANFRAIEKEIKKARELAKGGVLGVNIMVATQRYEEYVKSAVKAGIDIVISGAGLPIDLPKYVEGSKTKIAPIVSSLKSLTVICRMWERKYQTAPDLVVIEGPKAGGHLGFSREELETVTDEAYDDVIVSIIEKVKEYSEKFSKKIPVVVAGGIYERKDMEHVMKLGADGVQMGTRFVAAKESIVHANYKEKLIKSKDIDSEITGSSTGHPIRVIRNKMSREYLKMEKEGATLDELEQLTLGSLRKAVMDGDVVNGSLMAGQIAGMIQDELSCKEIITSIVSEAERLMNRK